MSAPDHTLFPHIFSPLNVGTHTLRNRVYVPAHQPFLAERGLPTERYIAYQRARARGGASMQITGGTPIMPSAVWGPDRMLRSLSDEIVPGYQRLAAAIRSEGGKILAQLVHPGATTRSLESGMPAIAPSRIVSELTREVARPMSETDIGDVVEAYGAAARRARDGHLDGVEILVAYGMLLMSFISPLTNSRDDQWGGTLENRLRLPLAVVEAVRSQVGPELMVGVRLAGDELVPGGVDVEAAVEIAQELAKSGHVDYLSIIAGNNLDRQARVRHWPPTPAAHGLFRHLAAAIKRAVGDLPVCCVGRITDLETAEEIVAAGDADLIGMVRAHIADPDLLSKARSGRSREIRPCVGANVCINHAFEGLPIRCIANPEIGKEAEWQALSRVEPATRAVVVGGGPAGLEAARVLALRDSRVALFERESFLGGQMLRWSEVPSAREFRKLITWWESSLRAAEVEVHLRHEPSIEEILALEPEEVVIATGSTPAQVVIAGDLSVPQMDIWTALRGVSVTTALVVDQMGLSDAALVAEQLAASCRRVVLATSCLHVGEGEGITVLYPILERLAKLRVELVERVRAVRIEGRCVRLEDVFGGASACIEDVDLVTSWAGGVAEDSLAKALRAHGTAVRVIGDAFSPRRAHDAVFEGAQAARNAFALI